MNINKTLGPKFILLILILQSCSSSKEFAIVGTRIIEPHFNVNRYLVCNNNDCDTLDLREYKLRDFSDPTLSYSKEFLYLNAHWKNEELNCYHNQILKFDMQGNLIDTIFQANACTDISSYSLAPNDTLMLIRTFNYHDWHNSNKNPLSPSSNDEKKYTITNSLINVYSGQIVDTFSYSTSFTFSDLNEYSWSPDCKKVIIDKKDEYNYTDHSSSYFHIYDLVNRTSNRIDFGYNVMWSPIKSNIILYVKDNDIWKYDHLHNDAKRVYQLETDEKFRELKWTPDGKFYIINYRVKSWCNDFIGDIACPDKRFAIIIDSETNMVVEMKRNHVYSDSWRY